MITMMESLVANKRTSFHNNNQEGIHALMQLFSGRGVPSSLRHVNAFSNHTYKLGKPVSI